MTKMNFNELEVTLLKDAGMDASADASPDVSLFFPFGEPVCPLLKFSELPGSRKMVQSGTGPCEDVFSSDHWKKADIVVFDGAPDCSSNGYASLVETLRNRGFTGKIENESAFLYFAIEALGEDTLLIDAFRPHLMYGSSALDRALREIISASVTLFSVTVFDDGDGTGDSAPRIITVLKRKEPESGHHVRFRRVVHTGEVISERDVPVEEMQESSVWVPDRFFVQKEQYLNNNVHTVQLGSLCRDIFRGAPGRFFIESGGDKVRYLSLRHIGAGLLDVNTLPIVEVTSVERIKRYLLQAGDVIVSCRGEFFRPIMLTGESDVPVTGGDNYVIIRPDLSRVDAGFLFRYLRSKAGQAFLYGMSTGKRIRVLNVRAMDEIPIPFPSLAVQKEVALNFTQVECHLEAERTRINEEYRNSADVLFQKMGLMPAEAWALMTEV
jgi:hypothetical protein